MKTIVEDNSDCKIFNLSITSSTPFRKKHMSSWASTLDHLSNKHDVLFLVSVGNIRFETIKAYHDDDIGYPDYLNQNYCKVANPSQVMLMRFQLSQGSVKEYGTQ
jgi:hypothetical protein